MSVKKGFTLAEVLVTLITIGVLAAFTIPSLVSNIGDQQNKIAWRKTFADFSQVMMRMTADNGGSLAGLFTGSDSTGQAMKLRNEMQNYVNFVKTCNKHVTEECWSTISYYLHGGATANLDKVGAVLNNGSQIWLSVSSPDCTSASGNVQNVCGSIGVDVNGFSAPNTIGKDVFQLYVMKDRVQPAGVQGDSFYNNPATYSCTSTGRGQSCSALYLYQ